MTITIDKAIKILDDLKIEPWFEHFSSGDRKRACKLGIEALKAIKLQRQVYKDRRIDLLPGETREYFLRLLPYLTESE